jgi:hypothetical protein
MPDSVPGRTMARHLIPRAGVGIPAHLVEELFRRPAFFALDLLQPARTAATVSRRWTSFHSS